MDPILIVSLIGIISWNIVLRDRKDPNHKLFAFLCLIFSIGCFIILLTRSIKLNPQTIFLILIIGYDLIKDGVKIMLRQIRWNVYKNKDNLSSEYLNGYKDAIDDMNEGGM